MDMSKAFDTVNRSILMKDLITILENDELHLIKILLNVKLVVRCGKTLGQCFNTNTSVPQGDCLSPILFIFYLANTLNEKPLYKQPNQVIQTGKHIYIQPTKTVLEAQYADDISWITNGEYNIIEGIKEKAENQLGKIGLIINAGKTEEHTVRYKPLPKKTEPMKEEDLSWKRCKNLGSLIDTKEDIKRRKSLAVVAMTKYNNIWKSKTTQVATKHRIFNSLVAPVFLYNCELLSVTDTIKNKINSFHRKLLRWMLNIKWPKKISNNKLKKIIKHVEWSSTIEIRRMSWFGHLVRLPEKCPAQKALQICEEPTRNSRSQKKTWIEVVKNQVQGFGMTYNEAKKRAADKSEWSKLLKTMKHNSSKEEDK